MTVAMILAGGEGTRVGADRPKQFVEVLGKPVLAYTIEIFERYAGVDAVEVVCHGKWRDYLNGMVEKYALSKVRGVADGGGTFQDSVMSGMEHLKGEISDDDYVLIQYGAAPFTSEKIVSDVLRVVREKGPAVSATPCHQLLGTNDGGRESRHWADRDRYIQIACPYGFRYGDLVDIYSRAAERGLLDTVEPHTTSLMYALGDVIHLAYGDQTNIKITTPEDLEIFEAWAMRQERMGK